MRVYKKKVGGRQYKNWSNDDIEAALQMVRDGASIHEAAKRYNITRSTISRRIRGITDNKNGGQTTLTAEEETELAGYVSLLAQWWFPITTFELRMLVKNNLDSRGKTAKRFTNNTPGNDWARSFLARHKTALSTRMANNVKSTHAQVSREEMDAYFKNLEKSLEGTDLFHESVVQMLSELRYEKSERRVVRKKKVNVEPGKSIGQDCDDENSDEDALDENEHLVDEENLEELASGDDANSNESENDEVNSDLEAEELHVDGTDAVEASIKSVSSLDQIKNGDWLAVVYDNVWWIAVVEKSDEDNHDVFVKFLHPSQSARVKFPTKDDVCWLPIKDVIGIIVDSPVPYGSRFFEIPKKTFKEIALKSRSYF